MKSGGAIALTLLGLGIVGAAASSGSKRGKVKIVQGTAGTIPSADAPDPNAAYFTLTGEKKVGPKAQVVDFPLHTLGKASSSTDLRADVVVTTTLGNANAYYGTAGDQFCQGERITATLLRSQTGVAVQNLAREGNTAACIAQVTPGMEDRVHDWPHDSTVELPETEIVMVGDKITLRVHAPELKFGTEKVFGTGEGHSIDWYQKHTGPLRYVLRIRVALRLVKS